MNCCNDLYQQLNEIINFLAQNQVPKKGVQKNLDSELSRFLFNGII